MQSQVTDDLKDEGEAQAQFVLKAVRALRRDIAAGLVPARLKQGESA